MKYIKHLQLAVVVLVPVAFTTAYILRQKARIVGLEHQRAYYAEKLDSAMDKLTPEALAELSIEVDMDVEFFNISLTSLKDVL